MEKVNKTELVNMSESSSNDVVKLMAKEALLNEFQGDEVAQKMIQLSQLMAMNKNNSSQPLDESEVKRIIREEIETEKISLDNLDATVRAIIENKPTQITLKITQGTVTKIVKRTIGKDVARPLIQNILSDVLARNNVYLYGGAGTGKTFTAKTIKNVLGWNVITVNCNQFTSQLELMGGQTIDGYQEGKVIRAFGNTNPDGSPMNKGCILLLDELPKIDPNTAGILNSALASVGEYGIDGKPSTIQNGKGDIIERGECFIMATGNSLLNTKDAEYEANFKQDLSLQDRFVGSTYKVVVNEKFEWEEILNERWAFIFIYLTKLRKKIEEEGFTSKAFVSIRLMQSVQKTYNVYRQVRDNRKNTKLYESNPKIAFTPAPYEGALASMEFSRTKTVKTALDEFFSLFTESQSKKLKEETKYDDWLYIVEEKDKLPMDALNTVQELDEVKKILEK